MSKHTPGPWNFDDDNGVIADVGAHICTVNMSDDFPCVDDDEGNNRANVDIECKANARLIAASPDLLEAVKALNVGESDIVGGTSEHIIVRLPIKALTAAAAAIAKAEGRS